MAEQVTAEELDETARIILMEMHSEKIRRSAYIFIKRLRSHHASCSLMEAYDLWTKYMGADGRIGPTHDFETGRRI